MRPGFLPYRPRLRVRRLAFGVYFMASTMALALTCPSTLPSTTTAGQAFDAVIAAELNRLVHVHIARIITVFGHRQFILGGHGRAQFGQVPVMNGIVRSRGRGVVFHW